jgi:predicted porin
MKKSLLALAALTAFAGASMAQSSVTISGRVDLSMGKNVGAADKFMANGSGSRLAFRGVEDLGGGMSALFWIEHRFNADTGAQSAGPITASSGSTNAAPLSRFWTGRSIVGLRGGFGEVVFGREYTTAFLQSQLAADPWGWDTVAANGGTIAITGGGGIAKVRNDSSITYKIAGGGFTFGAQIAEATDAITSVPSRPINFALNYAAGPLALGFGYEKTGREAAGTEKWTSFNGSYNFGAFRLIGFLGKGEALDGGDHKSWMISGVVPMGKGEFRAAMGRLTRDPLGAAPSAAVNQFLGLGYHHNLSRRTTVYVDFARNSKAATEKAGYDFGIKHNF